MARARSPARIEAENDYIESHGKLTNQEIAEKYGVNNQTVRKWKCVDRWEDKLKEKYPPKRGAQPGNTNAKGHGAPKGNTNALKHGGYSTVFFDNLTKEEEELLKALSTDVRENLMTEYKILVVKENRIKNAIAALELAGKDELFVDTVTVMETLKTPAERKAEAMQEAADRAAEVYIEEAGVYVSKTARTGEKLHMRITNNSSVFNRRMKLEELLIKTQGRIIKVLAEIKACDNERLRIGIERKKLSLAHSRITGELDINPDIPECDSEEEA